MAFFYSIPAKLKLELYFYPIKIPLNASNPEWNWNLDLAHLSFPHKIQSFQSPSNIPQRQVEFLAGASRKWRLAAELLRGDVLLRSSAHLRLSSMGTEDVEGILM